MLQNREKSYSLLLFSIIAAISLFRIYYIIHGPLDLSPDEAHYWDWTRRPALSYYSKGLLVPYLMYIGTAIFGNTELGVRIFAVLFSALSSLFMFKLVRIMYKDEHGLVSGFTAALLLQIIPLFSTFGIVFTIDSPYMFFWILSLYFTWKTLEKPDYRNWIILGVVVGLGLLAKYTMAFFYLCGFLFLIMTDKRNLLKTSKPYIAAIASLIVFSPVIIWNMQNDWVTLKHTAGMAHVHAGPRISFKDFFEFLGSQAGVVTPVVFFLMFYSTARLFSVEKVSNRLQNRFILYFFIPIIVFFLFKSLQGKVQANWAMAGYITGIIAFSRYFFGIAAGRLKRSVKHLLWGGLFLSLIVTAAIHYPSILNIPPKKDPSSRLRGWKPLAEKVSNIYNDLKKQGHVFIFSDRYQISSELAFYIDGHPETFCINLGRRMNQFDLWPDMNTTAEKLRSESNGPVVINGILVMFGNSDLPDAVSNAFDKCDKKAFAVNEGNYILRKYTIFVCYDFKRIDTVMPDRY